MYLLNDIDYKLIKDYKKTKNNDIALYFFEKFRSDVIDLVYWKVNRKFSSIPFEKGDIVHLMWNSIKKTLNEFKRNQSFNGMLVRNCYFLTIKEFKKFLNNNELVLNISSSYEGRIEKRKSMLHKNLISNVELPHNLMLKNLIDDVSNYVGKFKLSTIKRIIYLKSIGFSIKEISEKINLSPYKISDVLKEIKKITNKIYY